MNGKRTALLIALTVLLLPSLILAQGSISGVVTSTDGNPLPGVNVLLKGTTMGAATDQSGAYHISAVPAGAYTIMASAIGYKHVEKEIKLIQDASIQLNFSLETDVLGLSDVVITGVANPKAKLESSISVSTVQGRQIDQSSPRTTAEIFRTIPGIRSEASGGDGNTNITVRGVPISAGGSKYLQLQEDGLPILQFGDIAFATADIFLRNGYQIDRIEAIRGGSASTLASNSPAGIINFISNSGATPGGRFGTSVGLNYGHYRTDFSYGGPLNDEVSYFVGGFFRKGEGPRTAGYTANYGGQLMANLTQRFEGGYGRLHFKYLNDRSIAYMPMPLKVTGTNDDPVWESIDGYDANSGTPQSSFFLANLGTGPDGNLRRSNVADGMHPHVMSVGAEFVRELSSGWKMENRGRLSFISGRFISPFPAELNSGQQLAESIADSGATLRYVDGTAFSNTDLAMRIHLFDTELNNFNNLVNDIKLSKSLGKLHLTLGYYNSLQNISMSWLWNSYLMEIKGENAKLLDVYDVNGTKVSENGLYAYGVPAWGNLHRNYDTNYQTSTPYVELAMELGDNLNLDASFRQDYGHVTGSFAGNVQSKMDVNNDGVISAIEQSVSAVDNAHTTPVDYKYDYLSYSLGANYKVSGGQAAFARLSRGGSAKADRLLFAGLPYSGGTTLNAKDMLDQVELGYKMNFNHGGLFITGFSAKTTEEGGFEATTQKIIENDYQAYGVEVEGAYNLGSLDTRGGLTFTQAEITSGANKGNIPRRQPALMYNFIPTYNLEQHQIGLSLIGQTKAYAQDSNQLIMPGYVIINAFVNYQISSGLHVSLNANNLNNAIGITESEEASIVDNEVNYVRGRPIAGRSITATLGYNF